MRMVRMEPRRRDLLEAALRAGGRDPVEVEECLRRVSRYATSHSLEELEIRLVDGRVWRLIPMRRQ